MTKGKPIAKGIPIVTPEEIAALEEILALAKDLANRLEAGIEELEAELDQKISEFSCDDIEDEDDDDCCEDPDDWDDEYDYDDGYEDDYDFDFTPEELDGADDIELINSLVHPVEYHSIVPPGIDPAYDPW